MVSSSDGRTVSKTPSRNRCTSTWRAEVRERLREGMSAFGMRTRASLAATTAARRPSDEKNRIGAAGMVCHLLRANTADYW